MKLDKLQCPNCDAMLDIDIKNRKQVFCSYCGQKFLVDDGRIHVEITKNVNINKTHRVIDDAEIIRAQNEEKIERLRSNAKTDYLLIKLLCFMAVAIFVLIFILVIGNAIGII